MIKFLDIKITPVKICLYFLIIASSLIIFNNSAMADINQTVIEKIVQGYKDVGFTWGDNVKSHALWLLKWLLVIQLVVMAVKLGFKQSTLQDVVEDLVMTAIFGGIFWALIIKGQAWGLDLIQGMLKMAQDVAGGGSPPGEAFFSKVFTDALKVADNMMYSWNPMLVPAICLCSICSAVCGAFIYGMYLVILCESYIAFNLGIFILGFGGMRYTRGFATGFLKYALSVGLKLFVIRCLLYILGSFLADMVLFTFKSFTETLVITACFFILAFLIKVLPDTIAKMVTLHSGSSAGAITGAMAAGAGMAAGAASMGVGAAAGAAGGGGMAGAFSGARGGALSALEKIAEAVKPKEDK
ncbi:P-type conjugative transfer protein TrbL [Desulfobacter hydrogenophilus]|nr:P-type conjugative transfer protein TrbL [Desulfobacter hydrogenophilus]